MSKHLVITGAAGFLGQAVVNAALATPEITHVTACDVMPLDQSHPKLSVITGNLTTPDLFHAVEQADAVVHLAAILGGAAEADPIAALKVNVEETLDLIEACRPSTRFVFASSIAVLGSTLDKRKPVMVYGSHKAMIEIALETATRRGEIDGISLRPGGIVARAGDGAGLKSAFLSRVFWAFKRGEDITLPVSEEDATALASVGNVAANFMHAVMAPDLGPCRSLTLPSKLVGFAELVQALRDVFSDSPSKVTYAPDPDIVQLFSKSSPLPAQGSLKAGFTADKSLGLLIENALKHGDLT